MSAASLRYRIRGDLDVRRQIKHNFGFGGAGTDVHRFGRAEVMRQAQHRDAFEFGIELRAFVLAAGIDHQNFQPLAILRTLERLQSRAAAPPPGCSATRIAETSARSVLRAAAAVALDSVSTGSSRFAVRRACGVGSAAIYR